MGRTPNDSSLTPGPTLWPEQELLSYSAGRSNSDYALPRGTEPIWSKHKAELIREYLRLFLFITHHGIYIDGFAAPQKAGHHDKWTAKLVLEMEPDWFNEFWLCDISEKGAQLLSDLQGKHNTDKRTVRVLEGDFNQRVIEILAAGTITEKKATFALLDQRTFECNWSTVQALADHKKSNKIEIFYFLASGWLDRAIHAVSLQQSINQMHDWWGKPDVNELRSMKGEARAHAVAARFRDELKYRFSTPYPIFSSPRGGRVMYHMIHATDHDEAPKLMRRAYRKIAKRFEPSIQYDLEQFIEGMT
jgi:three-Cys-motif partner protein